MPKQLLPGLLICAVLLSACGVVDEFILPPAEDTVQEIFEAGNDAMREKDYLRAIKYYTRIKDDFPFSPYALESELAVADAYYLDKEYLQAADAYKDFEELHPRNEAIPYVLFQTGMALKSSYTSIDHSAEVIDESISFFTRVKQEYPDTEYGKAADEQIHACRKTLAQREIFIANVFWGMDNYQAAWTRFQYVVRNFPDIKEEAEYARTKGEAAYLRYRKESSQAIREHREGSWKDWFRWL